MMMRALSAVVQPASGRVSGPSSLICASLGAVATPGTVSPDTAAAGVRGRRCATMSSCFPCIFPSSVYLSPARISSIIIPRSWTSRVGPVRSALSFGQPLMITMSSAGPLSATRWVVYSGDLVWARVLLMLFVGNLLLMISHSQLPYICGVQRRLRCVLAHNRVGSGRGGVLPPCWIDCCKYLWLHCNLQGVCGCGVAHFPGWMVMRVLPSAWRRADPCTLFRITPLGGFIRRSTAHSVSWGNPS
jgi:hypothetical protein